MVLCCGVLLISCTNDGNVSERQKIAELQKQNDDYKSQLEKTKPIEFNEKAPKFGYAESEEKIAVFEQFFDPYLRFTSYYAENRPLNDDKIFYFVRPDDYDNEGYFKECIDQRSYSVIKQNENTLLRESLMFNDDLFAESSDLIIFELPQQYTLQMIMYWAPVNKTEAATINYGDLNLCFGKYNSDKFFNIYVKEVCIGTCYYSNLNCYMSYIGFKNFLYDHLIKL